MTDFDLCIVGGGIVGASIAYGELTRGKRVVIVDGLKSDSKASFANFGLLWVQGKGKGLPAYQALTKRSADLWEDFAAGLEEHSGISLQLEKSGGLVFCLSQEEFEARKRHLEELQEVSEYDLDWEMIGRNETQMKVGDMQLGDEVVGASYCRRDGAVNPLRLYKALTASIEKLGGVFKHETKVERLEKGDRSWKVETSNGSIEANAVVISAGLGAKQIAEDLGLEMPIRADKGQLLVTERRPQTMLLPASGLRQNQEGAFMIGVTHEGDEDRRSTIESGTKLAQRAIRIFPDLEHVSVVRQWAGHRITTPDTYPIYTKPFEGLTFAVCHSGVTLAAFHASDWMDESKVFTDFSMDRFSS